MFEINTKQVAHIVAQIRAKQLSTKYSQDRVKNDFVKFCESHSDLSDETLYKEILSNLKSYSEICLSINSYLKKQSLNTVGYPIQSNKTHLQLEMAREWMENQGSKICSQIRNGNFYHNLTNFVSEKDLPILKEDSSTVYWGNENSSVSSVLLATFASTLNISTNMPGASTCFPYLSSSFKLPADLVPPTYPFVTTNVTMLFGDYVYGAHRYFKEQLLFGPEDCSTAVGKATYLTTKQISSINTNTMTAAFEKPDNDYKYKAVTYLNGDVDKSQLQLIQPGDIFLIQGHTAILTTAPDVESKVNTLQFNRDIDVASGKQLGGGQYVYNLRERAKTLQGGVYILRPSIEPLKETISLPNLLNIIDTKYFKMFPKIPIDKTGDCRIFLE